MIKAGYGRLQIVGPIDQAAPDPASDGSCRASEQLVGCNEIKELQKQFCRTKIWLNFLTKPVQNANFDLLMKPKKSFNLWKPDRSKRAVF
jgi:hypothetical protein